jgi:3-hydroxyisobutyrate dehydrogenase-like beta-hydroxyacid dehydrogenase
MIQMGRRKREFPVEWDGAYRKQIWIGGAEMARRIGIVGLGLMGKAFAANLLRAGFSVRGFDIDEGCMKEFKDQGGTPVSSAAEAARGACWVLTSLPNSTVVREAVLGSGGVVEGSEQGLLLADTSTSRPEDSVMLGAELASRGIRFLDAAVSGTSTMARKKDLVVIAGGEPEDFAACRIIFDGFAKSAYHMGPVGSGARAKLIINLVNVCNRLGLAEGLVLGMKTGMNMESLLVALKDGAAGSKAMDQKGERMINADYSPESRLSTSLKDVHLMLEQGQRVGSPMFLASIYAQIAQIGVQMGYTKSDPACIVEVLRSFAGLPNRNSPDHEPIHEPIDDKNSSISGVT